MPVRVLPSTPPPLNKMPMVNPATGFGVLLFISFLQQLWAALTGITSPVATSALGTPTEGARAFVNDATTGNFNDVLVGGGALKRPVWGDGTDWRIG